jgi:hypothetical protein
MISIRKGGPYRAKPILKEKNSRRERFYGEYNAFNTSFISIKQMILDGTNRNLLSLKDEL